jgi:ABC-type multidrug transport system fused ATPase/permease subunit
MKADSTKEEDEAIPPMVWKESPEMSANIFSGILYFWLQPLFTRASFLKSKGKALEAEDLVPLPSIDQSKSIEIKFTESYKKYKESAKRNEEQVKQDSTKQVADIEVERKKKLESQLTYSLLAVCKQRLITAGIIKFFNTSLQFTFPILLNNILKFFEQYQSGAIPSDAPGHLKYRGYWLSCLLFFFISCKALTEGAYFHKVTRCAWQIKAAVSSSIYSKALRLASSEQQKTTLGEMVNLMQVDASKLEAFIPQIHVLWDGVFQIAGYMTILGFLLGWPCVIGLILMCCAGPVMGFIMGKLFGINRKMVKFTDERVKTVNEALQGIRCVKMYTWEGECSTHKKCDVFNSIVCCSSKVVDLHNKAF